MNEDEVEQIILDPVESVNFLSSVVTATVKPEFFSHDDPYCLFSTIFVFSLPHFFELSQKIF